MELQEYVDLKISKLKLEKIKKLYESKSEQEIIDQILDDIIYMTEMIKHMKKYEAKGNLKEVYA
ncbi:hypothetical protein L0Z72_07760 [candidate division KSB1 bacterium]|nr:hypothetical protein [candidate division KSB1 bacterium]